MRLPSRLLASRHGILYLRVVIPSGLREVFGGKREIRYSLRTRDLAEARAMARVLNAKVDAALLDLRGETDSMVRKVRLDEVGLRLTDDFNKYKVKLDPSGIVEIEAADPADHKRAMEALANATGKRNGEARPSERKGISIASAIEHYQSTKGTTLRAKSADEYRRAQERFARWVELVKRDSAYPISLVTKADIGNYVKKLIGPKSEGGFALDPYTVDSKHLPALSALFRSAQANGEYPDGPIPTVGHRLMTKKQLNVRRAQSKMHKPYTEAELKQIFDSANLTTQYKPHAFWMPLLALFTGARLNELCQLSLDDVKGERGIWYIDINNDDEGERRKQVKSVAAIRQVPLSKTLIDIGFLDYMADVKRIKGAKGLFPYLNQDLWGRYTHDPSRDWKKYREWIGVRADAQSVKKKDGGLHPLRYNANNILKAAGVPLEDRAQVVGHEVEGVNAEVYSQRHTLRHLARKVIPLLRYRFLHLDRIKYAEVRERMLDYLTNAMTRRERHMANKKAREEKEGRRKVK